MANRLSQYPCSKCGSYVMRAEYDGLVTEVGEPDVFLFCVNCGERRD